jgi:protein-L-isoaspartate(D-aspartate) O-methyltransferase
MMGNAEEADLDFAAARSAMVDRQLRRRGLKDERVLAAMLATPREKFIPEDLKTKAYLDAPLPIGEGQTISQPYIVGFMLEAAEIAPSARVLEVGGGSGYAAAVMSRLTQEVYVIERRAGLLHAAQKRWSELDLTNIRSRHGDGARGWPEAAPFSAIIVSAGGRKPPPALIDQLTVGGVMIIPVGGRRMQSLLRIRCKSADEHDTETLTAVSFVPLVRGKGA